MLRSGLYYDTEKDEYKKEHNKRVKISRGILQNDDTLHPPQAAPPTDRESILKAAATSLSTFRFLQSLQTIPTEPAAPRNVSGKLRTFWDEVKKKVDALNTWKTGGVRYPPPSRRRTAVRTEGMARGAL